MTAVSQARAGSEMFDVTHGQSLRIAPLIIYSQSKNIFLYLPLQITLKKKVYNTHPHTSYPSIQPNAKYLQSPSQNSKRKVFIYIYYTLKTMPTENRSYVDITREIRQLIVDRIENEDEQAEATAALSKCRAELANHPQKHASPRPRRVQLLMVRLQALVTEIEELQEARAVLDERRRLANLELEMVQQQEQQQQHQRQQRQQRRVQRRRL